MSSVLDKLTKIEALIQRASFAGEKQAAILAKQRILATLHQPTQRAIEYKVSFDSPWKKQLFIALCARYGFSTYRYYRQKYTTACLRISKSDMDDMLWPEFQRYAKILEELVEDVMQGLINKIHDVKEEEAVIAGEITN